MREGSVVLALLRVVVGLALLRKVSVVETEAINFQVSVVLVGVRRELS